MQRTYLHITGIGMCVHVYTLLTCYIRVIPNRQQLKMVCVCVRASYCEWEIRDRGMQKEGKCRGSMEGKWENWPDLIKCLSDTGRRQNSLINPSWRYLYCRQSLNNIALILPFNSLVCSHLTARKDKNEHQNTVACVPYHLTHLWQWNGTFGDSGGGGRWCRGSRSEQLATPAARRAQGQAVISDCWVEVGGWRVEVVREGGRDKSPLIKAMRAEHGLGTES